jgi:hypothetical protein
MRSKMTRLMTIIAALFLVPVALTSLLWYNQSHCTAVIYRSAEMSTPQFQLAIDAHEIHTVMNLSEGD